ncbi:cytochrome b5-like Heme/Steroid binding domain-containing protein [Colletotrichum navitas]|uniref:Cytochrome b5-like Heme/Steroid binding domain-containing protein n=1 Tax=Colletotrichum navitas TaxID=681940 RepID=A0AAD8V5J6_9PEZI|nr:cytochrome b5-like Heme/Steroid binding domain-containing protein [Colletotrichum navitas]KAK1593779.1 cytochrome b5-like Heme/Steroid binding domain-containing protein [Colletotrichum navitas]
MSIPTKGWARYYCVGKPRPRRTDGLSWIDPVYPDIDPVTLDLEDPSPGQVPQPTPPQLDDLYISEVQQINKQYGLRTWEAAVLAKPEVYTAEDEASQLAGNPIEVKEWTWFHFWARDRWVIDFTVPPNWSNEWTTEYLWSAQDPAVWGVLRQAIQLAEKMLRSCLLTPWYVFQALVNARNLTSSLKEVPLGSGQWGNVWRMQSSPPWLLTAEDTIEVLSRLLDQKLQWSFNDKSTQAFYEPSGTTHGLTFSVNGSLTGPIAIFIDILEIKTIMSPTTTENSRKTAMTNLADTLVHELMFGPYEHQAELGQSWEKATFGGKISLVTTEETAEYFHTTTGATLILGFTEWPLYWEDYQSTFDEPRDALALLTKWPVPALWQQCLSSQGFWDQLVAKFGPVCLRIPKMLSATTVLGNDGYPRPYLYPRDTTTRWVSDFAPPPFCEKSIKFLARELHARRQKYREIRPWFSDMFAMWQLTPWNARRYREELCWLKDVALIRKNDRHEADAQEILDRWIYPFQVGMNPDGSLGTFVPASYQDVPLRVGITVWFWQENRWKYPEIQLGARHTQERVPSSVRRTRLGAVCLARTAFDTFELLCIRPAGLKEAFEAACVSMEAQIEASRENDYMSWLDFDFDMPPYPGTTEDGRALGILEFWAVGKNWKQPSAMGYEDAAGEVLRGEDPAISMQTDNLPFFAMTGLAGAPFKSGERPRRHHVPYFTIAELYDHSERLNEPLVLVEDGFELDVYRCSTVCRSLGVTTSGLSLLTKRTFYGRQLTRHAAQRLYDASHPALAIARVVRVLRPEDIALGDGKDGRPFWIKMHRSVFDVTHLTCLSEPRLTKLLKSAPGGDPSRKLRDEGYSLFEIRKSLSSWRVGIVASKSAAITDRHSLRNFTPRSLRKHEFRETGMYISIDKRVYDITNYADLHPGGLRALVENAGRDCTELFDQYHRENRELIISKLQELCIGNLIEQRQEYQEDEFEGLANKGLILPHEIKLDRSIYSVQALKDSDEHSKYVDLVHQLSPYLGMDATQDLKLEEGDETPLLQFARLRGYVVATVERIGQGLPEIELKELRTFDGQVDEIRNLQNDSFVAADDMVYDLTGMLLPPCFGVDHSIKHTPSSCYAIWFTQPQLRQIQTVSGRHREEYRSQVLFD